MDVNYYRLFDQLRFMLPMLRERAVQAVDYGDTSTGQTHHRIEYMETIAGPQFVIRRVHTGGMTGSGTYLGDCTVEQVIEQVQSWIHSAHKPSINPLINAFLAKRHPLSNMRYFAYNQS